MVIKEKYDARSLTKEEKEKLTLIFQIEQGSSVLKTVIDNFKHLKDMETSKIITLTCGICFCFGGYYLYQNNQHNNKTKEFLALNENMKSAIEGYKDITIKALHSSKLDIEKIKFGENEEITKQQIQEMYKDITENEENTEPNQANYNFIVKKLYKKGNGTKKKNMATLYNEKIEIETEIVANLFENNESLFFKSYKDDTPVNCEIIEYKTNGKITKAILTKINQIQL